MRDETLLSLLDALEGLASGYRECAQRIYAAEYPLSELQQQSDVVAKMYSSYVQTRKRVLSGEPGLGAETERWNESAEHIEKALATLRKKLSQGQ